MPVLIVLLFLKKQIKWSETIFFLTFLKQNTSKKSIDRLTLFGLMVKPIQRFPQFIMLIKVIQPTSVKGNYPPPVPNTEVKVTECIT